MDELLSIGQVAARAGVATSALRFYEEVGLIDSRRTAGNQRRYPRSVLRVVSVIKAGQSLGIPLADIRAALEALPEGRTPTTTDWGRISKRWRQRLDKRIEELTLLRDDLDGCIGCGCLSLKACGIFNRQDRAARLGAGPRYLMGDKRP